MLLHQKRFNVLLLLFFLLSFFVLTGSGQENFNYHDYVNLTNNLKKFSSQNPAFSKLVSLGTSRLQKEIWLVTISDMAKGNPEKKPALLIVANLEGNQVAGSEIVLGIIERILTQAKNNNSVQTLLGTKTIYFIPRLNPDAAERMFLPIKWESENNTTPIDDDNDGSLDEDTADDLNKDGYITLMRIREPGSLYIPHPKDNRILKKADPAKNEMGIYNLLIEGIDNDGDKEINEDLTGGVNLNRNFPIGYEYFAQGTGIHQVSENETRALANFLIAHENITAILTFSANDNLIKSPKSKERKNEKKSDDSDTFFQRQPVTEISADDIPIYEFLSEKYRSIVGIKTVPIEKEVKGTFTDYGYFGWGIVSLATPGWKIDDEEKISAEDSNSPKNNATLKEVEKEEKQSIENLRILTWLEKMGTDPFINWEPVNHPNLPDRTVEVGGFKPFVKSNPPAKILEKLIPKQAQFVLEVLHLFPKIEIESVKVEKKSDDVSQIKAVIRNTGFLPTNTELGARMRLNRPTRVELQVEDQQILSGKRLDFIKRIAGAGVSVNFVWTVKGKGNITLLIDSPKGGVINRRITIN